MTKKEHERIMDEFKEAKTLIDQLNNLTHRIECAADQALAAYTTQGDENGAN